jgi:hypothetical protein
MRDGAGIKLWVKDATTGEWKPLLCDSQGRVIVSATLAAHHAHHQDGGDDEITVVGLSGLLADDQHVLDTEVLAVAAPLVHKTRHQDTGADEISLAGLDGEPSTLTTHKAVKAADATLGHVIVETASDIDVDGSGKLSLGGHKTRHQDGGNDEISVAGLSGLLGDGQTPLAHKTSHQDGGADEIALGGLSGDPADTINKSLLTAQGQIIIRNASAPAALAPGTSGQFLKTLGAGADPAWDAVDYPRKLKPNLTRWVLPGWAVLACGDQVPGAGVIYYYPIFVSELTTYDKIGVYVAGAGIPGSAAEMRVYNWNGGVPGTQVLNAGSVTTATTGERSIAITLSLARGYYFLALRAGGNADLYCPYPTPPSVVCPVQGIDTMGPFQAGFLPILTVTGTMTDPARAPTGVTDPSYIFCCLRESS